MTDELQAPDAQSAESEVIENEEVSSEDSEEGEAELAPATESEQEKSEKALSSNAEKAINKKHFQMKEAERKAERLEAEKRELEEKLKATEAERADVTVPEVKDYYDYDSDDDFRAAIRARDEAIAKQTRLQAQKEWEQKQAEEKQRETEQAKQRQYEELLSEYTGNARSLGVSETELSQAEHVINTIGIDPQMGQQIMRDPEGPLIAKYLAANPMKLEDLNGKSVIEAAYMLRDEIKPAVSKLKPQASQAPDPVEVLSGNGPTTSESPLLRGAKFE